MEASLTFALGAINAHPTVLPDTELRLIAYDSACDGETASLAVLDLMLTLPGVSGLLGDTWCSGATMGIAASAKRLNMFQLSGSAESEALSDIVKYPNFFRTIPPESASVVIFKDMFKRFGWRRAGVVMDYSTSNAMDYSTGNAKLFVDAFRPPSSTSIDFNDHVTATGEGPSNEYDPNTVKRGECQCAGG
jgi:ABC-type branched-subunit amino acid transport system substrate-binding protein